MRGITLCYRAGPRFGRPGRVGARTAPRGGKVGRAVDSVCNLKTIREALNKTQHEMAALLGVSARAVQSYEQGWRPFPPHVQKMAGLLFFLHRRKGRMPSRPC